MLHPEHITQNLKEFGEGLQCLELDLLKRMRKQWRRDYYGTEHYETVLQMIDGQIALLEMEDT